MRRPRLIGGPYRPPVVPASQILVDAIRGPVEVCGTSRAPVRWPIARIRPCDRPMPVVCGDLVRAIETESSLALQYHWGVSRRTVGEVWRRSLRVPRWNAGTRRLWSDMAMRKLTPDARRKSHEAQRANRQKLL